jgi:hypothetical protein
MNHKERGGNKMSVCQKLVFPFFSILFIMSLSGIVSAGSEGESPKDIKTGAVAGRIMIKDGGTMAGGQVMFYDALAGPPPLPDKYERTPDISRDIDADGKFIVELPEGKYYMGAIKRLSGERIGPPQEGDYIFRSVDEEGRPKEYIVKAGSLLNVGTISEAAPLKAKDPSKRVVTTAIEGVIIDMDGNPVEDAVVIAFVNPSMNGKPLFLSYKTDKDGKYILPLTEGTYYLRVRNSFTSGPPVPGQIVGYYGDGKPAPVSAKEGEITKGIDFKVIMFPGRGPFSGMAPQQ